VKRTNARPPLSVTADGKGIAAHAGTRLLAEMAEVTGLNEAMSDALAPTVRRSRRHDPGRVLVDLALMLADDGDCLSDLAVLRDQPTLLARSPRRRRPFESSTRSTAMAWRRFGRPGRVRGLEPGRQG
jgi:Transposase DDE domain group 1